MVLGIPTVKREVQSYLLATLQNLIDSMSEEEAADSLIVIFIAEVPHFKPNSIVFSVVQR
jgi:alpha-1,3-mannosylglycoprotein beta-1,4-N-acetylglucosaminyltransferase A/B